MDIYKGLVTNSYFYGFILLLSNQVKVFAGAQH